MYARRIHRSRESEVAHTNVDTAYYINVIPDDTTLDKPHESTPSTAVPLYETIEIQHDTQEALQ